MLRASHGGGIRQAPGSGLSYIAVLHAVLQGSVVGRSSQPDEAACAAACAASPAAAAFNYCPADTTAGCQMDAALIAQPAGSCHCLAQAAIQTPSLLQLLGSGSAISTVAGAPLVPELSALSPEVGGYRALPAYSLFGVGNTVRRTCWGRTGLCCVQALRILRKSARPTSSVASLCLNLPCLICHATAPPPAAGLSRVLSRGLLCPVQRAAGAHSCL